MELFKPGLVIDFMRYRYLLGIASFLACAAGLLVLFVPGPNYGICTSLFTSVFCSRLMFDWLVRGLRVERLRVG